MSKTLEGFERFDRKLQGLEKKLAKKIVKKATREAAKVTLKKEKTNAKAMVGGKLGNLIAKNMKVIVFKHQRRGSFGVQIGIKSNVPQFDHYPVGASSDLSTRKTSGKKSYIPAALEYGHDNAKPIPFIRSAWEATKARAVHVLGRNLKTGIETALK